MTELIRISNIENYNMVIINGELILTPNKIYITPNKIYITENDLKSTKIKKSTIENCLIKKGEETISTKKKYQSVLIDIWKSMPTQKIKQTTTFNFKSTKEYGHLGYNWCSDINMSFQNKDATSTLNEIVKMVKENNMSINLSIKLETGKIVNFKIE